MRKCFYGAAMLLAFFIAATAIGRTMADDTDAPEGRVAVTYETQIDWVYPPWGADQRPYRTAYTVTVWFDNGAVVQTKGYDEAMSDIASAEGGGWEIRQTYGPTAIAETAW